jgi:hypothetical protein
MQWWPIPGEAVAGSTYSCGTMRRRPIFYGGRTGGGRTGEIEKRPTTVLVGEDGPRPMAVTGRGRRVRWVETNGGHSLTGTLTALIPC